MTMFSDAWYDTCLYAFYVFAHTVILKVKTLMVNNVLFYNMSVRHIGIHWGMINWSRYMKEWNETHGYEINIEKQ